jgi:hypothetical protein
LIPYDLRLVKSYLGAGAWTAFICGNFSVVLKISGSKAEITRKELTFLIKPRLSKTLELG